MRLIPAKDFETVKAGYLDVIARTPGIGRCARWAYGKHPTDASLRAYLDNGEMYLLMDGDRLAGLTAVVMGQGPEYAQVPWTAELADDEVATLHLLAVCPDYRGRGTGRILVEEALELARRGGKKAVRLDTLESNLPAQRLYEKAGFACAGKQRWFAENTGWLDFRLYEKIL